ncbi:TPA: hypothetical protein ACF297_004286 [Klebsiella pneumoniae]
MAGIQKERGYIIGSATVQEVIADHGKAGALSSPDIISKSGIDTAWRVINSVPDRSPKIAGGAGISMFV